MSYWGKQSQIQEIAKIKIWKIREIKQLTYFKRMIRTIIRFLLIYDILINFLFAHNHNKKF